MNLTRKFKNVKKDLQEEIKSIRKFSKFLTVSAITLGLLGRYFYEQSPHLWHEMDDLSTYIISFALMVSLLNLYLKSATLILKDYIKDYSLKWELFWMASPFFTTGWALYKSFSLYFIPVLVIVAVHILMHYRSYSAKKLVTAM
ncbi:hypothetical protein POF51_29560 [Brevibacillus sp. AG]|uniref:hypothetical protein n=1 Tax=Brevibacillus sp. AG TaxID=3020891 RepID=UPI00232FB276|nr:hypothetical protein [Brevibacillus sp. AG]MDC0764872.1 hypothetical protein [Brevibacillus sp. AG]